jgi:predicted XRE-type DNA-binding protein
MEWKQIFKHHYSISEFGVVRNDETGRILKPRTASGYRTCQVYNPYKQYICHRLVALFFIGKPPKGKPEVNHIDADKSNNHYSNLEWVTRQENVDHAVINGLNCKGETHHNAKLSDIDVDCIKKLYLGKKHSQYQIASMFGIRQPHVSRIISGVRRASI